MSPGGRRVTFITYVAVTVREGVKGRVITEPNGRRHMWCKSLLLRRRRHQRATEKKKNGQVVHESKATRHRPAAVN